MAACLFAGFKWHHPGSRDALRDCEGREAKPSQRQFKSARPTNASSSVIQLSRHSGFQLPTASTPTCAAAMRRRESAQSSRDHQKPPPVKLDWERDQQQEKSLETPFCGPVRLPETLN